MPRASSGAPHSDSSSGDLVIAFGVCYTGPAPQALNFQGRAPRAEEARVLHWNWPARLLPGWVSVGTRPAPQGQLMAPQAEFFRGGSGGGQFGGQGGDLGRKCRFWYSPATPRSRREELLVHRLAVCLFFSSSAFSTYGRGGKAPRQPGWFSGLERTLYYGA